MESLAADESELYQVHEELFTSYHDDMNQYLFDLTGGSNYNIQDASTMLDLLESVATDCFWDELLEQSTHIGRETPLPPIKEMLEEVDIYCKYASCYILCN